MSNYNQPNCTHDPEDFHQRAINRGQRKINYKLTVVDKHLIDAVKALINGLAGMPNPPQDAITAASMAIALAKENNDKTASIRPPGCDET